MAYLGMPFIKRMKH